MAADWKSAIQQVGKPALRGSSLFGCWGRREGRLRFNRQFDFHCPWLAQSSVCPFVDVAHLVQNAVGEHQQDGENNELRPGTLLIGKGIGESVVTRAGRQDGNLREGAAKGNVDASFGVHSPAIGIENWSK